MTTSVATSGSNNLRQALSYCVHQVRKYDYAHYLCLLHLPSEVRSAAFALRAFNVETAKVGEVREPNLAMIRMVFWRDAIDALYKQKTLDHPVLQALAAVINDRRLSKNWFTRFIEARISDLEMSRAPRNVEEVEQYAENTASILLYLTLEAAGIRTTAADHAASHIGKAAGLALLLRSTPWHSAHRRTYIPTDLAAKHGLSQEEIYRRQNPEATANAIHEMASVANAHLEKARSLSGTLPAEAKTILLPAVPAGVMLNSFERANFNVYDPKVTNGVCGVSPLWMQLLLKWNDFRKTY